MRKNTVDEAVKILDDEIKDPCQGLPEDIFLFATRITPMVNVDLLIRNDANQVLLTWRGGNYYSPGWHIPGGIVRLRESMYERIEKVGEKELGAAVSYEMSPFVINEVIRSPERVNRTHFISFLFEVQLKSELSNKLQYRDGVPKNGEWNWYASCPQNIIPVHKMYTNIINNNYPEFECTTDFGVSRIISYNQKEKL